MLFSLVLGVENGLYQSEALLPSIKYGFGVTKCDDSTVTVTSNPGM